MGINEKYNTILYTPKDIQSIFGCGRKKSYEIMNMPGFPSFKIDTRIYVDKIEFEKWISKNKNRNLNT